MPASVIWVVYSEYAVNIGNVKIPHFSLYFPVLSELDYMIFFYLYTQTYIYSFVEEPHNCYQNQKKTALKTRLWILVIAVYVSFATKHPSVGAL